jgi:hypothetical protein
MTRFRIAAVTVAAVIALAAWWVPLKVGDGEGCPGGACAEQSPASGVSGSPDWFYGGEGMERIREGGDRPNAREGTGGGDVIHCDPDRYETPTDAGGEFPQSCEDVRARF